MKRILLPTDFSENARNAMEYALTMFGAEDMEYIIINIYAEPYSNTELLVSVDEILEKDSEQGLKDDHEYLKKLFPNKNYQIDLWSKYGGLPFEINRVCEEENIDYIVMGTKGASGLKKVLIGSNTTDVIKMVKTPVLTIPESIKYITLSQIALTTDYDSLHDKHALDPLVWIAKEKHSEIKIVNVRSVGEVVGYDEAEEGFEMHGALADIEHEYFIRNNDDVVKGISEFIHEEHVDMVAMLARKHRFFDRLINKSITKEMAMIVDIPLLVLHETAD